jgi:hypothetical protein
VSFFARRRHEREACQVSTQVTFRFGESGEIRYVEEEITRVSRYPPICATRSGAIEVARPLRTSALRLGLVFELEWDGFRAIVSTERRGDQCRGRDG